MVEKLQPKQNEGDILET